LAKAEGLSGNIIDDEIIVYVDHNCYQQRSAREELAQKLCLSGT
jgi:hypothetical protein